MFAFYIGFVKVMLNDAQFYFADVSGGLACELKDSMFDLVQNI
jgi:hypothetical protein